jgi:predicted ABC-type transport system involved in lysophospholipase L1 biosynthesis ATPase subunit
MRIRLARALAPNPALLLLEHPTATIERDAAASFADTVCEVAAARGLTLLAITEDGAFADRVSDRSLRLRGATGDLASTHGWRRWF